MNTLIEKKYYRVVDGPNKDTIIDASKYGFNIDVKVELGLKASKDDPGDVIMMYGDMIGMSIRELEYKDKSGNRLIIEGRCRPNSKLEDRKFRMDYNTRLHCGELKLL